jgi:hypothetical protein
MEYNRPFKIVYLNLSKNGKLWDKLGRFRLNKIRCPYIFQRSRLLNLFPTVIHFTIYFLIDYLLTFFTCDVIELAAPVSFSNAVFDVADVVVFVVDVAFVVVVVDVVDVVAVLATFPFFTFEELASPPPLPLFPPRSLLAFALIKLSIARQYEVEENI